MREVGAGRAAPARPRTVWQAAQRCARNSAQAALRASAPRGARGRRGSAPAARLELRRRLATTCSAMRACCSPQNSAHWPRYTARPVGLQPQLLDAARHHVDLAGQRRHPEAVDHVVAGQPERDRAAGRQVDLVGERDVAAAGRVAVAHLPPPVAAGDGDDRLGRPPRRPRSRLRQRRRRGSSAASTTSGKATPPPRIQARAATRAVRRAGRATRRAATQASSAITTRKTASRRRSAPSRSRRSPCAAGPAGAAPRRRVHRSVPEVGGHVDARRPVETPMSGIAVPGTSDGGSTIQRASVAGSFGHAAGDVAAHAHSRRAATASRPRAAGHAGDRMAAAAVVVREQHAAALDVGAAPPAGASARGPQARERERRQQRAAAGATACVARHRTCVAFGRPVARRGPRGRMPKRTVVHSTTPRPVGRRTRREAGGDEARRRRIAVVLAAWPPPRRWRRGGVRLERLLRHLGHHAAHPAGLLAAGVDDAAVGQPARARHRGAAARRRGDGGARRRAAIATSACSATAARAWRRATSAAACSRCPARWSTPRGAWSAAELYWVTRHGIKMSGMPAWQHRLPDADLWAVVAFMQRLPALTPAEFRAAGRGRRGLRARPPDARRGAAPGDAERGRHGADPVRLQRLPHHPGRDRLRGARRPAARRHRRRAA